MKKLGCAKCGKSMAKGGAKKMAKGGSMKKMAKGGNAFIAGIPNAGPTGPNYQGIDTMKKGGTKKYADGGFPDLTGDGKVTKADILKGRGVIKKGGSVKYETGGSTLGTPSATIKKDKSGVITPKKAKFGASVKVQRSPKAGKVRSASAQGYSSVGKREPARVIKKVIKRK